MPQFFSTLGSAPIATTPIAGRIGASQSSGPATYSEIATGGVLGNSTADNTKTLGVWHYPTIDSGPGSNWNNSPDFLQTDDNNNATKLFNGGSPDGFMWLTGFNFTVQPDAVIQGITFQMEVSEDSVTSNNVRINSLKLLKAGSVVGNDKADTADWPASPVEVKTLGSTSDLWGTTFTPSEVNNSGFGVYIQTFGITHTGYVDYARIRITYVVPEAQSGLGGVVGDSTCVPVVTANKSVSGGCVCGGTASVGGSQNISATGGVLIAGRYVARETNDIASGGLVVAGTCIALKNAINITASGGLVVAGAGVDSIAGTTASGGIVCGGSSRITVRYRPTASGGGLLSGLVNPFSVVGNGGMIFSDSAIIRVDRIHPTDKLSFDNGYRFRKRVRIAAATLPT